MDWTDLQDRSLLSGGPWQLRRSLASGNVEGLVVWCSDAGCCPYAHGALSPPAAAREKVLACSRVSGHVIVWAGSGLGIGRANVNVDMVARCSQCKSSTAIRYAIRGYHTVCHTHTFTYVCTLYARPPCGLRRPPCARAVPTGEFGCGPAAPAGLARRCHRAPAVRGRSLGT